MRQQIMQVTILTKQPCNLLILLFKFELDWALI